MKHKISGLFFGSILLFVIITSGCVEYKDGTLSVKLQNENITTPLNNIATPLSTPLQKQYINVTQDQLFTDIFHPEIPRDITTIQRDNYINEINNRYNNKYLTWTMTVRDVTSNMVVLITKTDYYRYDVNLFVAEDQKSKLSSLKKGENIIFQGKLTIDGTTRIPNAPYWFGITLHDGTIISEV